MVQFCKARRPADKDYKKFSANIRSKTSHDKTLIRVPKFKLYQSTKGIETYVSVPLSRWPFNGMRIKL